MSKYIRTKDHIYETTKITIANNCVQERFDKMTYRLKPIIKSADTIEELCDCIIGINDNLHSELMCLPKQCPTFWNGGVYGAIWTDKGLIYVAKMNNDGELELI